MKKENEVLLKNYNKGIGGITLIALVITIIVLLILAGVSIAMLTGENGILTKATTAKENTQRAEVIERAQLDIFGVQAENNGKFTVADLQTVLNNYFSNVPETLPDDLSSVILTTKEKYGNYSIKASEIHNHSYVETELKDCSDEIKATYKFKSSDAKGYADYGNEAIQYKNEFEVGDIVYVAEEDTYLGGCITTHIGYHLVTEIVDGGQYCETTLLGNTYPINVCSMCGANYK